MKHKILYILFVLNFNSIYRSVDTRGSCPYACLKLLGYMIVGCIAVPFIILYFTFVLLIHLPIQWLLYFWNEIEIFPDYGPSIRETRRQISSIKIPGVSDDPPDYEEHDQESDYL